MDFNKLFNDDREEWVINNEQQNKKELIEKMENESLYKLHNDSYLMLLNDFDSFKNNSLITNKIKVNSLNNMMTTFINNEEYEKCTILQNLLTKL